MTLRALVFAPSPVSLPADTPVGVVLRHMLEQRINRASVAITRKSGVFQYVAVISAKLAKADPWELLSIAVSSLYIGWRYA